MLTYNPPSIKLHPLTTADGSAIYTSPSSTHTLIAGVNYPLEVSYRSDEDPESTYVEVSVRPHNGVSMVRERQIEDVLRRTLRTVVLGEDTPRCMLQVTVQVVEMELDESLPGGVKGGYQGEGYLDLVVGAVNASVAACLDAAVRMRGFVGAVLVGVSSVDGGVVVSPNVQQRQQCQSLHAFAFNSIGQCVLMESEGPFEVEEWESAQRAARVMVCGSATADSPDDHDDDVDMDAADTVNCLLETMRRSVAARVMQDERWKA